MIRTEKTINTFSGGIDKDTSVNKYQNTHFYDAENMEIISRDSLSSAAATNVKGNTLRLAFSTTDTVIGHCKIRNNYNDSDKDSIVFFTVNSVAPTSRIYLLEVDPARITGTINLDTPFAVVGAGTTAYKAGWIYANSDLNFSASHPIKAEGVYESADIRKIYWVDGLNHYRYMILDRLDPLDDVSIFDINPIVDLSEPVTQVESGGAYTAGMIQYSYQLYIRNGARTAYAPLSPLSYLSAKYGTSESKSFTGSELGENTGKAVRVVVSDLDQDFDRIRIVALHYTEANISPTIKIVGELEYYGSTITFIDNGFTSYGTIPIEEFRILGQVNYTPDSIASKDNILFLANIKEDTWNPDWLDPDHVSYWDARAVRFKEEQTISGSVIEDDITITLIGDSGFLVDFIPQTDSTITCYVYNAKAFITSFIPSGRTVDDITAVTKTLAGAATQISGEYYNSVPADILFDSIASETTFTDFTYNAGLDTISFLITKTSGDYFTDFQGFTDLPVTLSDVQFTYEYYAVLSSYQADLDDTTTPITILQPTNPAILADWNTAGWTDYTVTHDGVNNFNDFDNDGDIDYEYVFQSDGSTVGAEGPNVLIEFETENIKIDNSDTLTSHTLSAPFENTVIGTWKRSSMREEVYRLYVVFFNTRMQRSTPQWICDLRMPGENDYNSIVNSGGIVYGRYLYPKVTIRNFPTDPDIVGWQIFRCERNQEDKNILAKGIASWTYRDTGDATARLYHEPLGTTDSGKPHYKNLIEFTSPEVSFNKETVYLPGDAIRINGRYISNTPTIYSTGTSVNRTYYNIKHISSSDSHSTDSPFNTIQDVRLLPTAIHGSIPEYLFGAITYKPFIKNFIAGGVVDYGQTGTHLIASLDSDMNASSYAPGDIMASYVRNAFNVQYGGNTYEARSYNQAIPYSKFTPVATSDAVCYYGDIFICYFTCLRSAIPIVAVPTNRKVQTILQIPVETTIPCDYRLDPINKYADSYYENWNLVESELMGIESYTTYYPIDLGDLYRQNSVYSIDSTALLVQNKIFDSVDIENFDHRVIATEKKVNNEYFDSWTNLLVNNYIELEAKYGPIRNIWNFQGKLFTGQDKGIAILAVNDRSLITDQSRAQLSLGTGGVLERYDYITTSSGIQSFRDVVLSDKGLYYLDRNNKIIFVLTADGDMPLSDVGGIRSEMKAFGNISNTRLGFDPMLKRVFFYITDGTTAKNIVYDEYQKCFIGTQTFVPTLYFDLNNNFYSLSTYQGWIHNGGAYGSFYGTVSNSTITLIINPNGEIVNKYDCLDLRVDVADTPNEMFGSMTVTNTYQNFTKTLTLDTTAQKIGRMWRTWLLPAETGAEVYRMTDTYVMVKFIRANTTNKKLMLHDVITYYRPIKN